MRDYQRFDLHYSELLNDLYAQPPDSGHTQLAEEVINKWVSMMPDCHSVLDVGAGQGFCQPIFEKFGITYEGISLGEDYLAALEAGKNVHNYDMNFLPYEDKSFDMVFSRHSLEHSPFPVISLLEWHRVARSWLCLVSPKPAYWGWAGRNHYSVMNDDQLKFLMARAGWHPIWDDMENNLEYRWMAEKEAKA